MSGTNLPDWINLLGENLVRVTREGRGSAAPLYVGTIPALADRDPTDADWYDPSSGRKCWPGQIWLNSDPAARRMWQMQPPVFPDLTPLLGVNAIGGEPLDPVALWPVVDWTAWLDVAVLALGSMMRAIAAEAERQPPAGRGDDLRLVLAELADAARIDPTVTIAVTPEVAATVCLRPVFASRDPEAADRLDADGCAFAIGTGWLNLADARAWMMTPGKVPGQAGWLLLGGRTLPDGVGQGDVPAATQGLVRAVFGAVEGIVRRARGVAA